MSRRVMKATATQTNTFLYDAWNMVQESTVSGLQSHVSHFVWGLDLSGTLQGAGGVGGLLAMLSPDSCLLTPAYDANGNITDLVDTNGSVVAHYEYDPYGNTIAKSGDQADANPFRFSSKYWDGETGFYYYGFRFYSPQLGRWLNRDPIGESGGLNLYGFIENNALNTSDYLGLQRIDWDPPSHRNPPDAIYIPPHVQLPETPIQIPPGMSPYPEDYQRQPACRDPDGFPGDEIDYDMQLTHDGCRCNKQRWVVTWKVCQAAFLGFYGPYGWRERSRAVTDCF